MTLKISYYSYKNLILQHCYVYKPFVNIINDFKTSFIEVLNLL